MLDSYVVYFSLLCASVYLFFLNASMSTGLCCNKCECIAFLLWLVRSVGNVALALKTYLRPNNRRINLFKFSQTVEITTNTANLCFSSVASTVEAPGRLRSIQATFLWFTYTKWAKEEPRQLGDQLNAQSFWFTRDSWGFHFADESFVPVPRYVKTLIANKIPWQREFDRQKAQKLINETNY